MKKIILVPFSFFNGLIISRGSVYDQFTLSDFSNVV